MIEDLGSGVIYRNPTPHLTSRHAWHPSLVHLGGQEWFCSFDIAEAPESHDYTTYASRSTDDGRTWSAPERLIAANDHDGSASIRVTRLRDGRLMGFGALHTKRAPLQGMLNPDNFGYTPMNLGLIESADAGATWSTPRLLPHMLAGADFETCSAMVESADGRLFAPTATWRSWDGSEPHGMKAVLLVSHDGGSTWPDTIVVRDNWDEHITNWEQSVVQLAGGDLVAVTWQYGLDSGEVSPSSYVHAADGEHFDDEGLTGFLGETTKMVVLGDESLLALYRRRDQPGLWATHARFDPTGERGARWTSLESTSVWSGATSGMDPGDNGTQQLSGLRFGYPSPVLRPDGDVQVAYWRRTDEINEIVWQRLRMTPETATAQR